MSMSPSSDIGSSPSHYDRLGLNRKVLPMSSDYLTTLSSTTGDYFFVDFLDFLEGDLDFGSSRVLYLNDGG